MAKRSFFERLTGSVPFDPENEGDEKIVQREHNLSGLDEVVEDEDGELTVDVHQTDDSIIIKTMVAGVRPEDLDINITRDLVTIKGRRGEEHIVEDGDYFIRELYWGSFSRTITLPEEIDVEESQAQERHGLLIVTLPKIDKHKHTKLKVKTG
jgi:HSP20 family protein